MRRCRKPAQRRAGHRGDRIERRVPDQLQPDLRGAGRRRPGTSARRRRTPAEIARQARWPRRRGCRSRSGCPRYGGSRPARRSRSSSRRRTHHAVGAAIAWLTTPPGSTLSSRRPARAPRPWKYHHGIPFWAPITSASGRQQLAILARPREAVRLQADQDTSASAIASKSRSGDADGEVALWALDPHAVCLHRPQVLAACDQRHVAPPRASAAPTYAPIAPAPRTANLIDRRSGGDRPSASVGPCRSRSSGSRPGVDLVGDLERGQRLARVASELVGRRPRRSGRRPRRRSAVLGSSTPKHDRLGDVRVREQDGLDLVRRDVLAAADDHLLTPPAKLAGSPSLEDAAGRRCGTSRRRRSRVGIRVVQVAGRDARAA